MQSRVRTGLIFFPLVLAASISSAASVSFVTKEPTEKTGEYRYIYQYTCISGTNGKISVISANDATAKQLAEKKGKSVCEE